MHAASMGALGAMRGEEAPHLRQHRVEMPRLAPGRAGDGVAVHRVAAPDHAAPLPRDRAQQWRQPGLDLARAHAGDQRQPAGNIVRVQPVDQPQQLIRRHRRPAFQPDRIAHAAQELHMRPVRLARPLANPQQMRRTVVADAGQAVGPRQRLLIGQQQRLVAGVELGLRQLRRIGHAAGGHEGQALINPGRNRRIARPQR